MAYSSVGGHPWHCFSSQDNIESMGQSLHSPPTEFPIVGKKTTLSLARLCTSMCHLIGQPADKTDNSDTHVLPRIASELADTYSHYLNELRLRTTEEDV